MKRENYIITVKSIYIRDAEIFCPEDMMEYSGSVVKTKI